MRISDWSSDVCSSDLQRIGVARAIALKPQLIVADEPTSALDVSLRAQVLDLLLDLREELDLSYIFISHDISVIRYMCDRVAVMYRGRIVEIGGTESICNDPQHPYTQSLISAVPKPDRKSTRLNSSNSCASRMTASDCKKK